MPVGKAMVLNEHGGVDKLTLVPDFSFPDAPAPGEVLVHVAATSVNPVDTYVRAGIYPAQSFPLVRQRRWWAVVILVERLGPWSDALCPDARRSSVVTSPVPSSRLARAARCVGARAPHGDA